MKPEVLHTSQTPQGEVDTVLEHNPRWPNSPGMQTADFQDRLLAAHAQSAETMRQEMDKPEEGTPQTAPTDTQPGASASV